MTITVNTTEYTRSHWHEPRGRGAWMFELSAPGNGSRFELYCAGANSTYSEARRLAVAHARAQGWTLVTVQP